MSVAPPRLTSHPPGIAHALSAATAQAGSTIDAPNGSERAHARPSVVESEMTHDLSQASASGRRNVAMMTTVLPSPAEASG